MEDFKTRLIEEIGQLSEKMTKLRTFLDGEKIKELEAYAVTLLRIQYAAMFTYWECLNARLSTLS